MNQNIKLSYNLLIFKLMPGVGCGKEECQWCNFVKTNKLAIDMHEHETGEE